jgi:hypothetical protein
MVVTQPTKSCQRFITAFGVLGDLQSPTPGRREFFFDGTSYHTFAKRLRAGVVPRSTAVLSLRDGGASRTTETNGFVSKSLPLNIDNDTTGSEPVSTAKPCPGCYPDCRVGGCRKSSYWPSRRSNIGFFLAGLGMHNTIA